MSQTAGQLDVVTIHYTARTRDGGIVEDTNARKSLSIALNDPHYLLGMREQIVGMSPGEAKTFSLAAEQVFGNRNYQMQLNVPLKSLPGGIREGEQLSVEVDGKEMDVWVIHLTDNEAILDTNHPLAGETLEYTVRLLSIDT